MRLQSELRLNGEVIQTGPTLKPGEELDLAYTVQQRGYGPQTEVSPVIAGSFLHLAVAGRTDPGHPQISPSLTAGVSLND